MPFIRYTRDRRGYETTCLMHGYRSAHGSGHTRVLYLFRSPAHVKVGRRALDDEAREALEHTHPDLSFDWTALGREPPPHHFEDRGRSGQNNRGRGPGRAAPTPAPPPMPVLVDDQTLLGRTLGAAEAARLRGRYGEVVRRIERRAPTPEDRDRLTERAQRLNPDDWVDEAAVRAGVQSIEAAWDAITSELPQRRWGGRGGRGRDSRPPVAGPAPPVEDVVGERADAPGSGASAIIDGTGEADASQDNREVAGAERGAAPAGDGDALGPDAAVGSPGRFPGGD